MEALSAYLKTIEKYNPKAAKKEWKNHKSAMEVIQGIAMSSAEWDSHSLEYVEDQTEEKRLKAVERNGLALKFVENQTREMCMKAVEDNGWALEFVKEQTEEICLAAVKEDGWALQYVKNQTPEICMAAVKGADGLSRLLGSKLRRSVWRR